MKGIAGLVLSGALIFAVMPSTSNYELRDFGFGSGGGVTGTNNYSLEGIAGEQSGLDASTITYALRSGLLSTQLANVPTATLSNPDNWYDRLLIVIGPSNNPSDALFAIAISDDGFVSTDYVQSDNTVGPALGIEDYQTYAAWGGASGEQIIGLLPDTTYEVRVKAMTGDFTETGYGPVDTAATANVSLTFDIDIAAVDTDTNPPYSIDFGDLLPSTVTNSPDQIWLDIETNANSGGRVFIISANAGLNSTSTGYTIASASGDLDVLSEGFGVQGTSSNQGSGGPLVIQNPYDGTLSVVGVVDGTFRVMLASSDSVGAGRAAFILKAKSSNQTPSATDYADTYTLVAAASF